MKINYNVASVQSSYVTEKTPQTSSKPYVIPSKEEITSEKTATQTTVANNFYDPFKAAKTGSVYLPEGINTKTEPKRSDEEILKDIEALAKEHARTGQFQDSDPRFNALMDEYLSPASPDRESILKNSTNEINERIASELGELAKMMAEMAGTEEEDAVKEAKRKNELLDYLMEAIDPRKGKHKEKNNTDIISSLMAVRGNNIATGNDNIIASRSDGNYTVTDINRGDGKTTTLVYDNQGNVMPWMSIKSDMYNANIMNGVVDSAFFYDGNGNTIMTYNKGELTQLKTREEHTKYIELQSVYIAVYDFSVGRYNPHDRPKGSISTTVDGIGDPTALIKEAYDRTYERLRNEAAAA